MIFLVLYKWGNTTTVVGTGTDIGTGKSNTDAIVTAMEDANFTEDYAAKACADSTLGGKDDWFLPSKDELNELYKQKGLVSANYWSSSEISSGEAWGQILSGSNESQINYSKDVRGLISTRAVRAF